MIKEIFIMALTGIINGRLQNVRDHGTSLGVYVISDGQVGKRHFLTAFGKTADRMVKEPKQAKIQLKIDLRSDSYTDQNGYKQYHVNQNIRTFSNLESKEVREARANN